MKKNIVFALSFVALAIFNTVSCNSGKFVDYTKESNVKLTLDYKGKVNESIEKIGKDYSTWIYIIHPIFITIIPY